MNDFAIRLAAARKLVALGRSQGLPRLPEHLVDQVVAATVEAHDHSHVFADVLRAVDPDHRWLFTPNCAGSTSFPDEVEARIVAAVAGCSGRCPHLVASGPQPVWARLAHRRIDCARCCQTIRRPPVGDDDRCDWCAARGVTAFYVVMFQNGPLCVFGDACPECASVFRSAAVPT